MELHLVVGAIDWAPVLVGVVTGATAVLVALFGLLGTRISARYSLRQHETDVQQQERERKEAIVAGRRDLYRQLLNHETEVFRIFDEYERVGDAVLPELQLWLQNLDDSVNGVILGAPREVAGRAAYFHVVLASAAANFKAVARHDMTPEDFAAFRRGAWTDARHALINVMRIDAAPDHKPYRRSWENDPNIDEGSKAAAA